MHIHIVPSDAPPERLSNYGGGCFVGLPTRSSFKKAIKRGEIFLNGEPGLTGSIIHSGCKIEWHEPEKKPGKLFHIHLDIIYADDHLAVINKPAGVVVSGNQFRTLENAIPVYLGPSPLPGALPSPRAIHRLDAATSGLIIMARTSQARASLGQQMEQKTIQKNYHTVVIGNPPDNGEINDLVDEKPTVTTFKKIRSVPSLRSGTLSLLIASPVTGRTHQIRKHLASRGWPVLGDKLYGKEGLIMRGKGLFLCATEVSFNHPHTGERLHF
ncbi:MAG: RluA family pseudouridine synthase, partial [Bacteroidota bacterium]